MRYLKNFALTYIPGVRQLRDFRNKVMQSAIYEHRLEQVERFILARKSAILLRQLEPVTSPTMKLIRVGKDGDGGYIMVDAFEGVDAAYSFGIANDVSWDTVIANKSIPVYMYDHTIPGLPEEHELFHFYKTGICGKPAIPGMKDIGELLRENGHVGKNLIMKIDIEGFEWPAFDALEENEISFFSQIVCEIHDLEGLLFNSDRHELISRNLQKILKHMYCIHIHANNVGWVAESEGVTIPVLLELTFARKDLLQDFARTDDLQYHLDHESDPTRQRIDISNLWRQE